MSTTIIAAALGVLGAIAGSFLSQRHYYKSEKKEFFKERLICVYHPIYEKILAFRDIQFQDESVAYPQFERLMLFVKQKFEQYCLNVPDDKRKQCHHIINIYVSMHHPEVYSQNKSKWEKAVLRLFPKSFQDYFKTKKEHRFKRKAKKTLIKAYKRFRTDMIKAHFHARRKIGYPGTGFLGRVKARYRNKKIMYGIFSFLIPLTVSMILLTILDKVIYKEVNFDIYYTSLTLLPLIFLATEIFLLEHDQRIERKYQKRGKKTNTYYDLEFDKPFYEDDSQPILSAAFQQDTQLDIESILAIDNKNNARQRQPQKSKQ